MPEKTKEQIREEFRQSIAKIDAIAQRRGLATRKRSPYGKRGGTSANAGKKAVTYEAILPGDKVVRKKSYHVHQPEAYLGCYRLDGEWRPGGIWANSSEVPEGQGFVTAKRVEK